MLKIYLPKFWSSSQRSNPQNPNQGYDRSNNGQFSMKPYGASSSSKSASNRKYGFTDLTIVENESEEAIVPNEVKQSQTTT